MELRDRVIALIREEMDKISNHIKWDGMYDKLADKIIDEIQKG